MKKISQREARRALKELAALKEQNLLRVHRFHHAFPGGTFIDHIMASYTEIMAIRTAYALGYMVVAKPYDNDSTRVNLYAAKG